MPFAENTVLTPKLKPIRYETDEKPLDLIIIGGGPAGLTAAIYAGRAMLNILVIEKSLLGGQVSTIDFIENYPGFPDGISGMDLSKNLEEHANNMGANFVYGVVSKIDISGQIKKVEVDGKVFAAKALIIASGAKPKKLNIPGEDALRGRGVSYCAVCDGAFYRNKKIIVVGGGNTAVQEAIYLTRYASSVSIVHRRDSLRADKILVQKAKLEPKIFFQWNSVVSEIKGSAKVEKVLIKDVKTGSVSDIDADGIFIYIGTDPETDILKGKVDLDEKGFIITDENMKTSVEGMFAAGDVRKKYLNQIVTAMSDGAIAAMSTAKYLENEK